MKFIMVFITVFSVLLSVQGGAWAQDPSAGQGRVSLSEQQASDQLDFAQGLLSRGMYDMAIAQYQKFISDYPQSPSLEEAYLSLGEGYFLSQNFDKAVETFNQFKQLYPHSDKLPASLLRLAQIDIQKKQYDEAIKQLTAPEVQDKLKGQVLQSFDYYTAKAYLGKEDTATALNFFQKAVQVEGASAYTADAYKEIGRIQAKAGHYPEAADAYAKAMPLAQDTALKGELTYRTAEVQFLSGQYEQSIKGFQQVMDQYSGLGFSQDALANMLLAYFNLGRYDQLLAEYQKNAKDIKDDISYFDVHFGAVLAYIESKQFDAAGALLDKLLGFPSLTSKQKSKIFIKKADILVRAKKYKDALALLEANPGDNADNADEGLFLKAQSYFGLGDYEKAYSSYENVASNYPNSRFLKAAILGEAHCRQETGKNKESELLFMKYAGLQDQADLKAQALYNAVIMAVKAGDNAGAVAAGEEYLKDFPNGEQYSDILLLLADNYGKNNQSKDAVKLLQGFSTNPLSSQRPNALFFLMGYNQQLAGNSDEALAAYSKVDPQKEGGKFYAAALKNMAIIYLNQKNFEKARTNFDQLISLADQNDLKVQTYIWVCNEYLKEKKYNDVLRVATQAEKKFPPPDLQEIEYFRGEALRGLGNCDEAVKAYDLVTASGEKNAFTGNTHLGRGLCLEKSQKFDAARQDFQKILDENANDYTITAHVRYELANLEAAVANYDAALRWYLLVATIYDDEYYCSQSLLKAGDIFERLKRPSEAKKMYAEILEKYKTSEAAKQARERMDALK